MPIKTMPTTDGQQEMKNLRELDAKTICAVYDQYFSEVYRYVFYRVGDQILAEDIASDVFVRLLEAVQAGNSPKTNLKGWLIGTASHAVTDHLRRKYRRPVENIPESLPDHGPTLVAEVDQREQNRAVNNRHYPK